VHLESVLPVNLMIRNEIRTIGAFAYSTANFETALGWIAERKIGLDEGVIKVPLEEGAYWFDRLIGNAGNVSKVLLVPPQD
jgi:threonine dehydrogenase-like Zn-dependent dehydrogenase